MKGKTLTGNGFFYEGKEIRGQKNTYIVTSYHTVKETRLNEKVTVCPSGVNCMEKATLVAYSCRDDLALLKLETGDFTPTPPPSQGIVSGVTVSVNSIPVNAPEETIQAKGVIVHLGEDVILVKDITQQHPVGERGASGSVTYHEGEGVCVIAFRSNEYSGCIPIQKVDELIKNYEMSPTNITRDEPHGKCFNPILKLNEGRKFLKDGEYLKAREALKVGIDNIRSVPQVVREDVRQILRLYINDVFAEIAKLFLERGREGWNEFIKLCFQDKDYLTATNAETCNDVLSQKKTE